MSNYFHPDTDFIRKLGAALPTVATHTTEEDIKKNMKQLLPNSWRLEGNTLTGETDMGPLVQTIDPAYILIGVDDNGLPMFRKVLV